MMNDHGGCKLTKIRQIVKLKEILLKWQTVTLGSRPNALHPEENRRVINRRLTNVMACDSDEESCPSPESPPDVPKGYLAVYVGPELRRFIIPTTYLTHPIFKVLLEKAKDEFGYDHNGGLTLPCEIEIFKYLLQYIEKHPKGYPVVDNSISEEVNACLKWLVVHQLCPNMKFLYVFICRWGFSEYQAERVIVPRTSRLKQDLFCMQSFSFFSCQFANSRKLFR